MNVSACNCARRNGESTIISRGLIQRSRRGTAAVTSTCVLITFLAIDAPTSVGAFRFAISQRPFSSPQSNTRHHHGARLLAIMSTTTGRPGDNDAVAVPVAADGQSSPTYQRDDDAASPEDMNLPNFQKYSSAVWNGARGATKQALLETVGYGVMDPVAYQSFEDSPIPPKHRPTTHVRVASGVHSFGQEFLGFPPEEGVSSFADSTATGSTSSVATVAMADDSGTAAESEGVAAPSAKIPGVGTRMTVIRLQNGEMLFHSPAAPTVQMLDMVRQAFPAMGPTSKVHLVSASRSPEHWAFVKHWKDIFPLAKVWAVSGPHRRFMGVEVDFELEQACPIPDELEGEIEVSVLEGVPVFREALLLHKPTGVLLSPDLLLAMDTVSKSDYEEPGDGRQQLRSAHASEEEVHESGSGALENTSTPSSTDGPVEVNPPLKFGESLGRAAAPAARRGMGRRLRWKLLDRTSSLLGVKTLAVSPPLRTILRAMKGNSAEVADRVLGWDVKVFVGTHGQSPLEGPHIKTMLQGALGRYVSKSRPEKEDPENTNNADNRARGSRIADIFPKRFRQRLGENEEQAIKAAAVDALAAEPLEMLPISGYKEGGRRGAAEQLDDGSQANGNRPTTTVDPGSRDTRASPTSTASRTTTTTTQDSAAEASTIPPQPQFPRNTRIYPGEREPFADTMSTPASTRTPLVPDTKMVTPPQSAVSSATAATKNAAERKEEEETARAPARASATTEVEARARKYLSDAAAAEAAKHEREERAGIAKQAASVSGSVQSSRDSSATAAVGAEIGDRSAGSPPADGMMDEFLDVSKGAVETGDGSSGRDGMMGDGGGGGTAFVRGPHERYDYAPRERLRAS